MTQQEVPPSAPVAGVLPSTPLLDDETPFATMMASFDEAARRLGIGEVQYLMLRTRTSRGSSRTASTSRCSATAYPIRIE